jgi:hypothetical protein
MGSDHLLAAMASIVELTRMLMLIPRSLSRLVLFHRQSDDDMQIQGSPLNSIWHLASIGKKVCKYIGFVFVVFLQPIFLKAEASVIWVYVEAHVAKETTAVYRLFTVRAYRIFQHR